MVSLGRPIQFNSCATTRVVVRSLACNKYAHLTFGFDHWQLLSSLEPVEVCRNLYKLPALSKEYKEDNH